MMEQVFGALAKLEQEASHTAKAVSLLEQLKRISPYPKAIQERIDDVQRVGK